MESRSKRWQIWLYRAGLLFLLSLALVGEAPTLQDTRFHLHALSVGDAFDFLTWEIGALASKIAHGLLAPQRFMDDVTRSRFVLSYLDAVGEAQELQREIEGVYADPFIADPLQETAAQQRTLDQLRASIDRRAPVVEAILEEQIGTVLVDHGFGLGAQILPPVSGAITPLPYVLIISPRDHIESYYQKELVAGMTPAQQAALEYGVEEALPDFSAYVTPIGGLSAYPAMLLERPSIDWLAEVLAHEWTHHYLMPAPLGWEYFSSAETRTINETTASLMGEWVGQEVVRRFYLSLLNREKRLPDPLVQETGSGGLNENFDFYAEMRRTRVAVDRLLSMGKLREAEWYMKAKRLYFALQGYNLRRLNQAYFAFHGAYASRPGAAGSDPVGPTVRRLWALSPSPRAFMRQIARATTLLDAQHLIGQAAVEP